MQICVLQVTYPDGHILREHDEYADPGRYVKKHSFHRLLSKFNFDGSLLDIACGTGLFGRLIRAKQ
ncbi:hypothetical protein NW767_011733 [Fusarium falciforme]|nr:hypothetical protein NW767_011733 [Fusarium falciforme]